MSLYGPGYVADTDSLAAMERTLQALIDALLAAQVEPLDGSVTDVKVAVGAEIDQAKIAGLVADLAAKASAAALTAEISARAAGDLLLIPLTQKGAADGVATLGADGKVPSSQLPALAIGEVFTVASQAAMLALAAQRGDLAIRTDLDPDGVFILASDSPSTLADWIQITAPGAVISVNGQSGAVVLPVDGAAGVASLRTLGTGATQAAAGNDARLSDQRVPTDGSVATAKLADGAVTTPKLGDASVTDAKMAPGIDMAKIAGLVAALGAESTARASADVDLAADLLTHTGATAGVHGIVDTATLVYTGDARLSDQRVPTDGSVTGGAGAGAKIAANTIVNANVAPGAAIDMAKIAGLVAALADETTARAAADTAEANARLAHEADTTGVHGIADTSTLVVGSDPRLTDQRTPLDNSVNQAKVVAGSLGIDRLAVDPRARATHTGTQLADTIVDLATAVQATRLDQFAAPTGPVNMAGQRLTNGPLPVALTDFITKEYADGLRAGLLLKADPVRVMVDANVNVNAPGAVHDSIALTVGDRLLLTAQVSANDNGLYVYNGAAVPLTRAPDANTDSEMRSGTAVWVLDGTYADQRWALVTADPISLGVTAQAWAFDGGLAHVTAGDGLTKTGHRIDVGEGTGLEVLGDSVGIAAGGVGTTQLADDAVTAAKLADNAVDTAAIVDLAVTTAKLADGAVTTPKLADDAVTSDKLGPGSVDTAAIADGAVALAKLGFDVATQVELDSAVAALELALASKLGVHWITAPTVGETPTEQRVRMTAVRDAWAATGGVLAIEPALYEVDGPIYWPEDDPPGAVFSTWMVWGWGARIQAKPTGVGWAPWFILDDTLPVARTYLGSPQTAISRLIARAGRKITMKGLELSGPGTAPGTYVGTAESLAFITGTPGAAGAITGTYRYQCTFIDAAGNETPGSAFSLRVTAAAQQIDLSTIPIGPVGTTARKLYRTKALVLTSQDGSILGHANIAEDTFLLATIADNVTTTYADNNGNDASLGAPCPMVGGVRLYGSEQVLTEQCNSEFLNVDVDLIFGLLADLGGWQTYHCYNFGLRIRSAQDLVVGAAHSNSSGNVGKVRNYRCYGANNTLAHIDVIGTNEVELYGITTEGLTPENAIRFNRDQSPNTQRFVVKLWHPEFAGGAPRDAELKVFGGPCRIVLEDTSFTTPNAVLVSVSESLGGNSVEVDRVTFTAVGAKFDNGTTNSDWTIRGAGSSTATIPWADASRWVGGLVPASLKVERWSSSGAPDYMAGTHPVDVYSKYLLQSLTNVVIRTGIADPQLGVTIEGAVAQRTQEGALHPNFLGPVSGGAGAAGANYFTWTKDEALKQYRIWGKDSAGNVLAASLPYGPDSGAGAALKNGYTGLIRRTAAPIDDYLLASEAVPWFDHTSLTPAVVWKAKSADGTVRTQRLELAGGPGAERYLSLGNLGATPALNVASGTVQQGTLNANASPTFTAPPVAASYAWSFTLILRQDGTGSRTVTWPAAVKWPSDSAPVLTTTAGRADVLTFFTVDGGTTWNGSLAMANIP